MFIKSTTAILYIYHVLLLSHIEKISRATSGHPASAYIYVKSFKVQGSNTIYIMFFYQVILTNFPGQRRVTQPVLIYVTVRV